MSQCYHCNDSLQSKWQKKFCSRSCAATYNNKRSPKRKLEGRCRSCEGPCTRQRTYCRPCWLEVSKERSIEKWETVTLGEMRGMGNANAGGRYPYVRALARKKYIASGLPMQCRVCSYSLHVDIAHLREVKDFPPTATIAEVNHINNLAALCKNHHWELDNGYMEPVRPSL